MTLEELKREANQLSIEDLRELAEFCDALANALEEEEKWKKKWVGKKKLRV